MTKETKVAISSAELIKIGVRQLLNLDVDAMHEIAVAVENKPALVKQFDADPLVAAKRINGITPPEGFHMRVIDENNDYHPKEGDALQQIGSFAARWRWRRFRGWFQMATMRSPSMVRSVRTPVGKIEQRSAVTARGHLFPDHALIGIAAAQHLRKGSKQDDDVESQIPVADVPKVQIESLLHQRDI
jgi:hypothetical protein